MARNRSDAQKRLAKEKIYFPYETTTSTSGLVGEKAIYRPQCNTWFKRVHADEPSENCYYPHPCIFLLLPARQAVRKKEKVSGVSGKGAHRKLPKRYLEEMEELKDLEETVANQSI